MRAVDLAGSETIRKYEIAAENRFSAARHLIASGFKTAGVYLFGYAVEMWIHGVYFRYQGFPVTKIIRAKDREFEIAKAPAHGLDLRRQHDFVGWTRLYVAQRAPIARAVPTPAGTVAYDAGLGRTMVTQAVRAYTIWTPALRYYPDELEDSDVREVLQPAEWFRENYAHLYS